MSDAWRRTEPSDLAALEAAGLLAAWEHHEILASTNDRALKYCACGIGRTPLLVFANAQTAGRGRGQNAWLSEPGALTFSLVLSDRDVGLSADRLPRLSLLTAIAVAEALEELEPRYDFLLKWPNDVFVEGRKVAGILLERSTAAVNLTVVGVGVNVNNPLGSGPPSIRETAIALCDLGGRRRALADALAAILRRLQDTLRRGADADGLVTRWRPRCLLADRWVAVAGSDRRIEGRCRGIDDRGALVIETANGAVSVNTGTIERYEP